MNRKRLRKLRARFAARGGMFGVSDDAPPEVVSAMLQEVLSCPECRAVVLEACSARDHDVDIDAMLTMMAMRGDH